MFKLTRWLWLCSSLMATSNALAMDHQATHPAMKPVPPRSVILIIGDGMDEQQITIARNYLQGAAGELQLDRMPLRANVQVLTIENSVDGKPVYVADSANTATSMATGAVTSRGRLATTAGSDEDLPTIMELAAAAGYRTGIVTTASITDATPAAFATHVSYRLCEDPDKMIDISYKGIYLGNCEADLKARGGPGSIAEQLAESELDLILGGGAKHFQVIAEGESLTVLELAKQRGFQAISDTQQLSRVNPGQRLLGLFSKSTMPVRLRGENGREAEAPDPSLLNDLHPYLGKVTMPEPMSCEPNPAAASVPSLKQMTDSALKHLGGDDAQGFLLVIESASIDKQSHRRSPCGSIGEVEQLEEALTSALAWAARHPRTLILVTADHTHAAQLVPVNSLYAAYPVPVYTPGKLAIVRTPEGSLMAVNYATNNFQQEEHTGASVPLFSNKEGIGRVKAYLRQPEIFTIIREYLAIP